MVAIARNFGSGGSGLTPAVSAGEPYLATILRDIALDLADLQGASAVPVAAITANIAAAALPAYTDPPAAAEMAATRTLVNELRALVVELRAVAVEDIAARTAASGTTLRTTAP